MLRRIGILTAAAIAGVGAASAQSVTPSVPQSVTTSSSSTTSLSDGGGTATVTVDGVVKDTQNFPAGTSRVTAKTRSGTLGQGWSIQGQ